MLRLSVCRFMTWAAIVYPKQFLLLPPIIIVSTKPAKQETSNDKDHLKRASIISMRCPDNFISFSYVCRPSESDLRNQSMRYPIANQYKFMSNK